MKKKLLLLIVVLLLTTAAIPVQELPDFSDLGAVITWLATGGAHFAVMWGLSLLVENWKGWNNLPTWLKFLLPIVASVALAAAANLALQYMHLPIFGEIAPWYGIVVSAVVGWLGSQGGYMQMKRNEYGARFKE